MKLPSQLVDAVLTQQRITRFPHALYRYPARFSPEFARQAIHAFTRPGDLVFDPFCGGGTTIVEALSLGRRAIGCDINTLAAFLTRVKTTPLSIHDKREILGWLRRFTVISVADLKEPDNGWCNVSNCNLPWRLEQFLGKILTAIDDLPKRRQQDFARVTLLSVGQTAVDCRDHFPTNRNLWRQFAEELVRNVDQHRAYAATLANQNAIPRSKISTLRRILVGKAEELDRRRAIPAAWLPARLVLTSPPYPGVHVLYHRWQIRGRRETALPYRLVNQRNGHGEAYFTLGARQEPGLRSYFDRVQKAFGSIRTLLDSKSLVVQLVAFNRPDEHLPRYLHAMASAGFDEQLPDVDHPSIQNGRLWRIVPGRKWYAHARGNTPASREVLLLHRLRQPDSGAQTDRTA